MIDVAEIVQQVQKRMLISLAQVSKNLKINEGDHVLLEERDGGIFIRPISWHDKNQEYFWTEEWQEKMKKSAKALEEGRFKTVQNTDELLKELGGETCDADDNSN